MPEQPPKIVEVEVEVRTREVLANGGRGPTHSTLKTTTCDQATGVDLESTVTDTVKAFGRKRVGVDS